MNLLEKLVRHYHRGRSSRQEQGIRNRKQEQKKKSLVSYQLSIGYHRLHVGGVSVFTYNPDLTIPFGARSAPRINNDSV